MFKIHNPDNIPKPISEYTHGISVEGATKWLYISGQVGAYPRERLAGDSAVQMNECWRRIFALLADAGMDKSNIVKVTAFLTRPEDVDLYRQIRDDHFKGHIAASSLLIVSGLADPSWLVEIEAIAAA